MAKMMNYLKFENCLQAIDYYKETFGAQLYTHIPVEKSQAESFGITGDLEKTTMHAAIGILGNTILCSDSFGREIVFTDSNQIMIDFNSEDEKDSESLEKLYKSITKHPETKIVMPLEEQFWGGKMGCIEDKYGITWAFHAQPYSKLEMN